MRKYLALLCIPNKLALIRACTRSLLLPSTQFSLYERIAPTYAWLCSAQDASADQGVNGEYHLIKGWSASYPETTGYIIPTFLRYSEAMNVSAARERALRMAEWEMEVQLSSGAVRSGYMSAKPTAAVFNTGQVLFGWMAAYVRTRNADFAKAAERAATWLLSVQDVDGAWRRHLSGVTKTLVQTYNVRAAWGLALAGIALEQSSWVEAARRNCDWAITQQNHAGWFENASFTPRKHPPLHTIAYILEAFVGMGLLLKEERYLYAAERALGPLVAALDSGQKLCGAFDRHWSRTTSSSCLTGNAQTALTLLRLSKAFPEKSRYFFLAEKILQETARSQDIESPYPETRGAIAGSEPIWGSYARFTFPNWAAKFYLDALLLAILNVDVLDAEATA